MASVARAIEQAASKSVNGDLWWEPHTALFYALDKCGLGMVGGERDSPSNGEARLVQELKAHHGWLLNTLDFFKAPNEASKNALSSSRVDLGRHSLDVKPELREIALQVSTHLVLDEVQSYILLSRHIESGAPIPFSADRAFLQNITMYYYVERQCLLKCSRLLLTFQMADEGETLSSYKAMSSEVKQLVEDGLEDKTLANLKDRLAAVQPQHLDREYTVFWAEETVLEQSLLLDILFLLYYEPLNSCKAARFKELLSCFQATVFGRSHGERFAFSSEAAKCVVHVRQQAVLILIEAFDLENLLLMVHDETPFSQGGHTFSVAEVQELDSTIGNLSTSDTPEYAPLLLGWATFLCLISFLPADGGQALYQEMDLSAYVRQAYDGGAYGYLLEMLRSESFKESDVQVGGYKSVVKTLAAAFLAAYDSATRMNYEGYDILINIFCEIYRGQESLCLELWDRDSVIDGPIRNLLFTLREDFPYQTLSLVRLLAAQCKGSWPAECVYDFLYRTVKIASLYQQPEGVMMHEDGGVVQANVALQVPDAPGLMIPRGTLGRISRIIDGRVSLVHWECEHSGIVILLLRMLQRSASGYQLEEVHASLDLLQQMLASNKLLAQLLLDLDGAVATVTARRDGRMEDCLRIDVVAMICAIVNGLAQSGGNDVMLSSCLHILGTFALCSPRQVIEELDRTSLLQAFGSSIGGVGVFAGSLLQNLLQRTEQSTGDYPLTFAALDFTKIMVQKGVEAEMLSSLVMFMVRDLLVNHGNWKYQQPHQRWQITTQAFQVSLTVLTGATSRMSSGNLRRMVLDTLLFDSSIQDFIFQILSIGPTLEELHCNRAVRPRELEWVQHALHTVLLLIHHVLLDVTVGLAAKDYPGMSLLEQSLLRKFAGPLPVVAVIASFLSFSRNVDMQLASAKALTSLCVSAQKARPHSVSIASYISSPDQRAALRSVVCQFLAEEGWISQQDLFIATTELLTTAVKWQPSLVAQLLFPAEQAHATSRVNGVVSSPHSRQSGLSGGDDTNEVLDVLWKMLLKSAELVKSHPQMLSRVLFLLASIWQGGVEYIRIIEAFRQRPNFWRTLASGLSFASGLADNSIPTLHQSTSDLNKHEILLQAFRYKCEASILSIMACDMFLQQYLIYPSNNDSSSTDPSQRSNNPSSEKDRTAESISSAAVKLLSSSKSGAFEIISEWAKKSATSSILKSYAVCAYDQEVTLRAKAEARLLIVGMMGKILGGDIRGISAFLLERLQQIMTQVFQLSSFEELVAQYTSRGYSHGKQLQVMLMSDLYHHLQGEIGGGRPLPTGPFQQIAAFLLTKESELVGSIGKAPVLEGVYPAYGNGYLYDTKALEDELGLEWWPQTELAILPSSVVERSLSFMQRANAMASLGHSQLSALRSWAAVVAVSIFDKHGARGELGASEFEWNDEDMIRCIEDLCKALESAVTAFGVAGDISNHLPTFMTLQAHLQLIFVRWLWIRRTSSSSGRVQLWAVCAKIVRTNVGCLKLHLDSHAAFRHHGNELVKELLGAFLIALEIIYAHNGITAENAEERTREAGQELGDVLADVTLTGLSFLPALCTAVEHPSYANLALAGINLLIKGFIAPTIWVSILQNHLPIRSLLGRMHADSGTEFPRIALNICLSLARTRVGAEMLQNVGIFSHLLSLSKQFQVNNKVMSGSLEGPFSVWPNQDQPPEGQLWSLQLAVVTALIHSGGEEVRGGSLVESAFTTYIASLKELLLSSLRAPVPGLDTQGRKKAKLQQPRTTITTLQEVQHVVSLLCELASHQMTWRRTLPDSIAEFEEMTLHLLAYIAREGLVRSGVYHSSHIGIRCQPVLKEEISAHTRPSIVGSNAGWFAVCARGCAVKEINGTTSPSKSTSAATTTSPLRTGSSSPSSGLAISAASTTSNAPCTEYSDLVAIDVYRLVLLLLKFTCKQVQHAVDRFENGGTNDYSQFPQLPAPEVLYPLQDQVGAILIEVLRARDGKAVQGAVKDVCLLLLSILEKSLYLGVSVSRSCGLNPHPVRVDDFGKEYRALISASQSHQFLESPLRSLKRIVALAYPEIS